MMLILTEPKAWNQKAVGFVTRSHRHLWGKNNENPLVFLYNQGLTHAFIRQMHLGWNKHGQQRDLSRWGLSGENADECLLTLPAGIVVPHIVEKHLTAVVIAPMTEGRRAWLLPGSSPDIILGHGSQPVQLRHDLFSALRAYQDTGTPARLHPDLWGQG